MTFMLLNQACMAAGVRGYTLDLVTETPLTPEIAGFPDSAGLPTWLRNELATALSKRGFGIEELSSAVVAIDVLAEGDGSMFGIRVALIRNSRVIARALDPSGRVVQAA